MSIYRLKGTSGPLINQAFSLSERLLIGRSDDCDIRIDSDGIAAHQAEVLLTDDGGVMLRNIAGPARIQVNGEPVDEVRLAGGDEIQLGNCRLMLQAPGLRPDRVLDADAVRPSSRRWPWLLVLLLGAAGALAWRYGYFDALMAMLQG